MCIADDKNCTLDGALDKLYCRSQMYLARQMSRLRPEMTMPMFSGVYLQLLYNIFLIVKIYPQKLLIAFKRHDLM